MKMLQSFNWIPRWVSHIGCLQGCLEYLDLKISPAWLYGGTGHAFILNLHEEVCPSGPTAWNSRRLHQLGRNLGYQATGYVCHRDEEDFSQTIHRAWEGACNALDNDLPCYAWELKIPEFYVICGYDQKGYYFTGPLCEGVEGPHPWKTLGGTEIGVLELYVIEPGPVAEPTQTVREALQYALVFAESPVGVVFPDYRAGLEGYDLWIKALTEGPVDGHGNAYNAVVWHECRRMAGEFLREAAERLPDESKLLIRAAEQYDQIAIGLEQFCGEFPFELPLDKMAKQVTERERCRQGVEILNQVQQDEATGLQLLREIVAVL
ncbi:MAG: hypothetical protein ISR91_02635 [Candidatus Delongbacteria bacterium]|nr:hypothetical protein [bacterium]MBL7033018.1 hypothetical protein [Candidatus Delongbacteria bacterium]